MGTTVIFQDSFKAQASRTEALKGAEMKWLEEQLGHTRDLVERIVQDLKSGVDVKIVGPDGSAVVAKAVEDPID